MKYILNKLFIYLILFVVHLILSTRAVFSDGTENLGTPSIKILTGMEVIASGTGLVTQPTTND